jgi:hypothetical protein
MINNQTTTAEFLTSDADIEMLFDLLIAENTFNSKDLISQPFQNVMDILAVSQTNDILKAVLIATGFKEKKLLKTNCNDFLQYFKWLIEQTKLISNLMASLATDDFDEDSMLLQASGVEKLNRYNEIMIYYNIDKNPTTWEAIGKITFATIFTKLSIDKDISEIQKSYNQLVKQKNK